MPDLVTSLAEKLSASHLEAQNILPRATAFADTLISLRAVYSVSLYDRSLKIKEEINTFPSPSIGKNHTFFQKAKLALIKSQVSGDLKAMWQTVVTGVRLEQELFYALDMYELPVEPKSYITILLDALNEAGALRDAKAVGEGREIFENLSPQSGLIRSLELHADLGDVIQSRFYSLYTRKGLRS